MGFDLALDLGLGVRMFQEVEQVGKEGVDLVDRRPTLREPVVLQARASQPAHHRVVDGRIVLGKDGMQREPDQRRLDDGAVGEGRVEVGRVEVREPVPQREVRRRRLLCLEGEQAANGLTDIEPFAVQEELPAERGPVELPGGQWHATNLGSAIGHLQPAYG